LALHLRPEGMLKAVYDILGNREMSISAIHRELERTGVKCHRLMLTGYLQALVDTGRLRVRSVPPSKVYTVLPRRDMDIYQVVEEAVRGRSAEARNEAALRLLAAYFRRPVFATELRRCGASPPRGAKACSQEERRTAMAVLRKAGIRVPPKEKAYTVELTGRDLEYALELLVQAYGAGRLMMQTKQATLDQL